MDQEDKICNDVKTVREFTYLCESECRWRM